MDNIEVCLLIHGDYLLSPTVKNTLKKINSLVFVKGRLPDGRNDRWEYKVQGEDIKEFNQATEKILLNLDKNKKEIGDFTKKNNLTSIVRVLVEIYENSFPNISINMDFINFLYYTRTDFVDFDIYIYSKKWTEDEMNSPCDVNLKFYLTPQNNTPIKENLLLFLDKWFLKIDDRWVYDTGNEKVIFIDVFIKNRLINKFHKSVDYLKLLRMSYGFKMHIELSFQMKGSNKPGLIIERDVIEFLHDIESTMDLELTF